MAVNKLIEKMGIEKSFEETETGKAFKSAGMDMSSFVGGITTAFILVISVVIAIQVLNIGGTIGEFLVDLASYLPRLLGGIVIIVIGSVLVGFLATLVGNTLKPIFPKAKVEIADMLQSLLQIGLIAVINHHSFGRHAAFWRTGLLTDTRVCNNRRRNSLDRRTNQINYSTTTKSL